MRRTWFSTRLAALALAALLPAACGDDSAGGDKPDAGETPQPDAGDPIVPQVLKRPSKSSTIAIGEDDKYVVMVNPDNDTISIFRTSDLSRVIVAVGNEPSSVVIGPDHTTAFVANRADATVVKVTGINTATPQVSAPVATGSEPTGLALSPTGATLFVAEYAEGSVLMIDTATMTIKGQPIKGNIQHPRSVAVTNDGDADDSDELLLVPEFFGEPNENASNAETLDRSRGGRVRIYSLAQAQPVAVDPITFSERPSGVTPTNPGNVEVHVSPNQLYNIAIRRDAQNPGDLAKAKIYVPAIGVAPSPPVVFDGNVYSMIYVGDLGARSEVTGASGTVNLFDKIFEANRPDTTADESNSFGGGKVMLGDVVDIAFTPSTGNGGAVTEGAVAYAVSRAGDAVQRITFADNGVTVGGSVNLTIDVVGAGLHTGCKAPYGIVINLAGDKAYVPCLASQTLGVVLLGNEQRLDTFKEAFPPVAGQESIDRGRRFFATGRARWSGNGNGAQTPTINNLGVNSCFSCHPDGLTDNVTWIFNAGPRQTTSMDGTFSKDGELKQRMLNWTGIFDEIHDFERNTRDVAGGLGAITTAAAPTDCGDFTKETRDNTIVATDGLQRPVRERQNTNAGNCQKDWDDIEEWVKTIRPPRGLKRLDQNQVNRGRELFVGSNGTIKDGACVNCHGGSGWTLSRLYYTPTGPKNTQLATAPFEPSSPWPSVWNAQTTHIQIEQPAAVAPLSVSCVKRNLVGGNNGSTFGPAALEKKNVPLLATAQGANGFNIPALYGMSLNAPYLHSGLALTLRDLFDRFPGHLKAGNDNFDPSADEKDALAAFILSIDATTPQVNPPSNFDKCIDPPLVQ